MWTPLPHFPLFRRTHLVKPGAADRTAGLLMITFSRCPIVLYPLTFPSEENSQWTATAPSQMPFLLLLMPCQPCYKAHNRLKQGGKEIHFTFKAFFILLCVLKLAVSLFAVYHYVLEKECEFVLLFLSKSFFVSFPFSFPSQQGCYFQNTALCPNAIQLCKNMGQHIPRMKTQN